MGCEPLSRKNSATSVRPAVRTLKAICSLSCEPGSIRCNPLRARWPRRWQREVNDRDRLAIPPPGADGNDAVVIPEVDTVDGDAGPEDAGLERKLEVLLQHVEPAVRLYQDERVGVTTAAEPAEHSAHDSSYARRQASPRTWLHGKRQKS